MFRPMRSSRYSKLLASGFTRQEARALSAIPLSSVPYMRDIIKLRIIQVKHWLDTGEVKTRAELYRRVAKWYVKKGFTKPVKYGLFKGGVGKDVWAFLRWAEREFAYKYPTYVSPNLRKRRDFVPFKGR